MVDQAPELSLIAGLCRELATLGLNVGMSDAKPAAVIRPPAFPPLWVTVDASGGYFEWSESGHRHPVTDPAGAAARISDLVEVQRLERNDPS